MVLNIQLLSIYQEVFMPLEMRVVNYKLVDPPEGTAPLFLAKVPSSPSTATYCAVLAPEAMQHPEPKGDEIPLVGATVAIFDEKGSLSSIYPVLSGCKLVAGGGVAYLSERRQIQWTTGDECGRNEFLGIRIPLKNVFVAF